MGVAAEFIAGKGRTMGLRISPGSQQISVAHQAADNRVRAARVSPDVVLVEGKGRRSRVRGEARETELNQALFASRRDSSNPQVRDNARTLNGHVTKQDSGLNDRNGLRYDAFRPRDGRPPTDAVIDTRIALSGEAVRRLNRALLLHDASQVAPAQGEVIAEYLQGADRQKTLGLAGPLMMRTGGLMGGAYLAGQAVDALTGLPLLPMAFTAGALGTFDMVTQKEPLKRLQSGQGLSRLERGAVVDNDLLFLVDRGLRLHKQSKDKTPAQANAMANVVDELLAMRRSLKPEASEAEAQVMATLERYALRLRDHQGVLVDADGAAALLKTLDKKAIAKFPELPVPQTVDAGRIHAAKEGFIYGETQEATRIENPHLYQAYRFILAQLNKKTPDESQVELSAQEVELIKRRVGPDPSPTELLLLWPLHQQRSLDVHDMWPGKLAPIDRDMSLTELTLKMDQAIPALKRGPIEKLKANGARIGLYAGIPLSALTVPLGLAAAIPLILLGRAGLTIGGGLAAAHQKRKEAKQGLDAPDSWNAYGDWLTTASRPDELFSGTKGQVSARLAHQADMLRKELEMAEYFSTGKDAADEQILAKVRTMPDLLDRLSRSDGSPEEVREQLLASPEYQSLVFDPAIGQGAFLDLAATFADAEQKDTAVDRYFLAKLNFTYVMRELVDDGAKDGVAVERLAPLATQLAEAYKAVPREKLLGVRLPFRPHELPDDSVVELAREIAKNPQQPVDAGRLREARDSFDAIQAERHTISVVPEKRAGEIAQEALDAMWTEIFPTFGTLPREGAPKPPSLKNPQVEVEQQGNRDQQTVYRVSGALTDGGTLSVLVNGFGYPDMTRPDFMQLTLGQETLRTMASNALKGHLRSSAEPMKSLGPLDDHPPDMVNEVFQVGNEMWKVDITPSGFVAGIQPWSP
jgi:hypothetical protein